MNERIQELMYKADEGEIPQDEMILGQDFLADMEPYRVKVFAELIVQECIQTLRDNTPVLEEDVTPEDWDKGYIRAMVDCEHHIKEHFGIE
jgi:hypothetical protein